MLKIFICLFCFIELFSAEAWARSRPAYQTIGDIFNVEYHQCVKDKTVERTGDIKSFPEYNRHGLKCECIYRNIYGHFDFSFERSTFVNGGEWKSYKGIWIDDRPVKTVQAVEEYISQNKQVYMKKCSNSVYLYNPFMKKNADMPYELKNNASR